MFVYYISSIDILKKCGIINIQNKMEGGNGMKLLTKVLTVLLCASMGVGTVQCLSGVDCRQDKKVDVIYSYCTTQSKYYSTENADEFEESISEEDGVNIIYRLDYEPYDDGIRSQITHETDFSTVESLLASARHESKRYHSEKKATFIESMGIMNDASDYDIIMDSYSPFLVISFDTFSLYEENYDKFIENAVYSDEVKEIFVESSREVENTATIASTSPNYSIADALIDIEATSQTYTGDGIKVGIMEAGGVAFNSSHSELNGVQIYTIDGQTTVSSHAVNVTRLLCGNNGVARGIDAAYIYYVPTTSESVPAMEWFLENNCNIINLSMGVSSQLKQYGWFSGYMDYHVRYNHISVVAAAGNYGSNGISPPGTGYNVITVANVDANWQLNASSSYGTDSSLDLRKPTVAAPGTSIVIGGENIGSGTSYSAPIVSGVIAKLMQQYPALKILPEAVIAILAVSAENVSGHDISGWDPHVGAGLINYENAQEAANNYATFALANDQLGVVRFSTDFTTSINRELRVVAVWLAPSLTYNENFTASSNRHTDFDLYLDAPNSSVSASLGSSNIEFIKIYNSLYRTLTAKIKQAAAKPSGIDDYGAIAWFA